MGGVNGHENYRGKSILLCFEQLKTAGDGVGTFPYLDFPDDNCLMSGRFQMPFNPAGSLSLG